MQLREYLEGLSENSESYFRRALAKEDVARIDTLIVLVGTAADKAAFMKDGRFIGWTQNDITTYRLTEEIDVLLEAIYARLTSASPSETEDIAVMDAWNIFHKERLEKLIHCL